MSEWVLVPREATDAMIAAQYDRYGGGGLDMAGRYRTMIDAATAGPHLANLRAACNLQCRGCREGWPIHRRSPALPGRAELVHTPAADQVSTWVAWPMDCEAWRVRRVIEETR